MNFKVTIKERQNDGSIRTINQHASCQTKEQVIDWYGLNEPDVVDYCIEVDE